MYKFDELRIFEIFRKINFVWMNLKNAIQVEKLNDHSLISSDS